MIIKRYADIKVASEYTSLAVKTLYDWAASGKIPSIKIGKKVLFDLRDIDKTMADLKRPDPNKKEVDKILGEIINNSYNNI